MAQKSPSRVVVGIDESLSGLRALRWAVMQARERGAVLHAVRVWNFDPAWQGSAAMWVPEIEREATKMITRAFSETLGGLPDDITVVQATPRGAPGRALVDYAHKDDDVLVLGSGQRGWLRRLFRPSVLRYCVAHAVCPVLAVPADAFARMVTREGVARSIRRDLTVLGG